MVRRENSRPVQRRSTWLRPSDLGSPPMPSSVSSTELKSISTCHSLTAPPLRLSRAGANAACTPFGIRPRTSWRRRFSICTRTQFAIGPLIEFGFYYDVELPDGQTLSDDDLERIEARMQEIVAADQVFERHELPGENGVLCGRDLQGRDHRPGYLFGQRRGRR